MDTRTDIPAPWAWGKELLDRREADPPYDMLVSALTAGAIDLATAQRWCLGFWLFYNVGVASWLAERKRLVFWTSALDVAEKMPRPVCLDGKWPRGGYRRYFRGKVAVDAILDISAQAYPEDLVSSFYDGAKTFDDVRARVEKLPTYGYTMSFKIADMGERVFGHNIAFDRDMRFPDEPEKGIGIAMELFGFVGDNARAEMFERVFREIWNSPVPGLKNRRPRVQEIETIFCEFKHMLSGKFVIGQDGPKLRSHLKGYGDLADALSRHLP